MAARRLVRLHPAQIADLVEAASHEEGEEILEAVGQDKELEADVFEELDDEHQVEFLRERSDAEAAAVLARMASDDAADLLIELDQDRRLPILNLMPAATQRKVRALLGYNPSTAGGMMNPDFFSLTADATVAEALTRIRTSSLGLQQVAIVCVVDEDGKLIDTLSLAELVRADGAQTVSELVDDFTPNVPTEADIPDVARIMSDYNLIAVPVLDLTAGRSGSSRSTTCSSCSCRRSGAAGRAWPATSSRAPARTARRPRPRCRSCPSGVRRARR